MTRSSASGAEKRARLPDGSSAPLPLVLRLVEALEGAGLQYCHWKSTAAIERSLSGDNDLDLLVGRRDVGRFTAVLSELGFVRTCKPGASVSGIESFYGSDFDAGRWVHVHAHYQLVLGDDRTKNYRLPVENAYIRAAAPGAGGLRIPVPEFEFLVLVIRLVLKYCTWDELAWCAVRGRRAGPSRSERHELEHLRSQLEWEKVTSLLDEHLPMIGPELFAACVAAVSEESSVAARLRVGRGLETALRSCARRSRGADRALRVSRRVATAVGRRTRPPRRNRLVGGGALVGIMGGDGAGKSTALAALESWLTPEFDVRLVHLGKPTWSATTTTVRAALKAASATTDALRRHVGVRPVDRLAVAVSEYRPLLWLLCTARDRERTYRSARRQASNGSLVLCDRYPHPRLGSMEVPLIASRAGRRADDRVVRAMISLEERYHRAIAPPELLVVLRVDPEVAVARKVEETPESVRRRGAEIWNIDWRAAGAHVVDASQSREVVARELEELVWSAIA